MARPVGKGNAQHRWYTKEEIDAFARYLAGSAGPDPRLHCVAVEALNAACPDNWAELEDEFGYAYFYNNLTDESTRTHPLDEYYKMLYRAKAKDLKEQKDLAKSSSFSKTGSFSKVVPDNIESVTDADDEPVGFTCTGRRWPLRFIPECGSGSFRTKSFNLKVEQPARKASFAAAADLSAIPSRLQEGSLALGGIFNSFKSLLKRVNSNSSLTSLSTPPMSPKSTTSAGSSISMKLKNAGKSLW
eukprot:CAMPEP_0184652800 /NCGR_PEP_ID=MMETSP0308-20130426/10523_1 /TAXON_ID=38269 /ORGANISM="Gloeochaete witrockiana, Strain SAG 46.84" /LENGTH=243 /DNA_ID=CAMNT_0027087909 /DNA_START=147 /DNA_END=875 /DNA_ORIENTATION=-